MTITEFLEARIAEDERANNEDVDPVEWCDRVAGTHYEHARIAAECAAKRAIIESYENISKAADRKQPNVETALTIEGMREGTRMALVALMFPYKDHPDYWQEWAL